MKRISLIAVTLGALAVLVGCAAAPSHLVRRPWQRFSGEPGGLRAGAHIDLRVTGEVPVLLGSSELADARLRDAFAGLLERRGFRMTEEPGQYVVELTYRTLHRGASMAFAPVSSTRPSVYWLPPPGKTDDAAYAFGVGTALLVSALASDAAEQVQIASVSGAVSTGYTHTVAMEARDSSGRAFWKADSTWDSRSIDILAAGLKGVVQVMLSAFAADPGHRIEVPILKPSRAAVYYDLFCASRTFVSPGLPYAIDFGQVQGTRKSPELAASIVPKKIIDPEALPAFVDLIETAEYALPKGGDSWEDPLNRRLWTKAMLGRQYVIGPAREVSNVLILLAGTASGYHVEKCWLASDAEFREFQDDLARWKKTLIDFYDFYES